MPYHKLIFFLFLLLLSTINSNGQHDFHSFSPLSNDFYSTKVSEFQKRIIPTLYDNKKEQKTYAAIIKNRNSTILNEFIENRIVYDTLILKWCAEIVDRIRASNPSYHFEDINLFINRSPVANACCFGEGTLFINLGMLLWIDSEDELALIIGHELSHQFLGHVEANIKKNIALLASDDFKNEMKDIKKSSEGKYERYKNLMKGIAIESGVHSRFKETDADSLGLILVKKAGYNIQKASTVLLKLNYVDDLFLAGNLYNVRKLFFQAGIDSESNSANRKYMGLSLSHIQMNADKDFDSIKTHPDCLIRFKKVSNQLGELPKINCCTILNTNEKKFKERALVELIRYEFESNHYTMAIHLCLFGLNNGFTHSFYNLILSAAFSRIGIADKELMKFSVTDAKANPNSTLKELQDLIFKCNASEIMKLADYYLSKGIPDNSEDFQFAKLQFNILQKILDKKSLEKDFVSKYPKNKYNYLITSKAF